MSGNQNLSDIWSAFLTSTTLNTLTVVVALTLTAGLFATTPCWAKSTTSPARVVTLSPALTELVYALHLEQNLVGVSDFSDYPVEARKNVSVGPYTKPSLEKIYSLHPDLVLIPDEGPVDIKDRLDQIKAPYKVVSMRKLSEIPEAAITISRVLGHEKEGQAFAKNWRSTLTNTFAAKAALGKQSRAAHSPAPSTFNRKPHVLIEVQSSPMITAGAATFLDELVSGCGGVNVVTQSGYPQLSIESLTQLQIDAVILTDYFSTTNEKTHALENLRKLPNLQKTKLEVLDPDFVSRPGPRLLQGAKMICAVLHSISKLATPIVAPQVSP